MNYKDIKRDSLGSFEKILRGKEKINQIVSISAKVTLKQNKVSNIKKPIYEASALI